jgi:hypothetical protein
MNRMKILLAVILFIAAAGAAKATKARAFIGYIYNAGAYSPVYVPYDCPDVGYGCYYVAPNGRTYQVYMQSGVQFYPLQP